MPSCLPKSFRMRYSASGLCWREDGMSTSSLVFVAGGGNGRKQRRTNIVRFPQIDEDDDNNIELDSLEEYDGCDEDTRALCKKNTDCYVDEIVLPAESLQSISDLKNLTLRSNGIQNFPNSILRLKTLVSLDLSDNSLLTLPPEIDLLENLKELVLDQNLLSVLPKTLWNLRFLKVLRVASNRIAVPPDRILEMKALILAESELNPDNNSNSLTTLNLRSNRLKGHIVLGNYGFVLQNLTELDVSENNIEHLDLSAIEQLEVLQCSRNALTHLNLYGKNLTSIIAGNNKLKSFTTIHPPLNLKHLDISYNDLEIIPDWLCSCTELRSLFASNNHLVTLPEHLFCNEMPYLHSLQLAYNQLQYLPTIQRRLPIQELFLQNNSLSSLPENLFKFVNCIRVLNVSNNRLCDLPKSESILLLEKLYLTANCLTDKSLEHLTPYLRNLRSIHAAYNNFTNLPEDLPSYWSEIEEMVFSGNKLQKLPEQIGQLKHLSVLRVHSNLLQTIPKLSKINSLRVLDLAHNQLDRVDLSSLIPPNLKFLDLSCNTKLYVDSQQFNNYRTQRPMSLVDVSGKNRTSLPLTPSPFCEDDLTESSWTVGFSETAGSKQRLYVAQIRLSAFCNTEGLFGLFDGESNNDLPANIDKIVPRVLLEERTIKETAADYMKYTLLTSNREIKEKGHRQGITGILCHVTKSKLNEYSFGGGARKYTMKIASIGEMRVVLGRAIGPVRLLPMKQRKTIRTNPTTTALEPDLADIQLDEKDEYMILANKSLWDVISPESAIKEVSLQRNVILAAKRLQDLAQSYGAEENLSVIVVKFNLLGSDVDLLMRELRQTIKRNKYENCRSGCCCDTLNSEMNTPALMMHDDRSSPSGQSEHACSDCNSSARLFVNQMNKHFAPTIFESPEVRPSPERRSYRGVAKALRAKRDDDKSAREDSDSALSEEQFKCWEYMLEQNTQLLFDKELNTLSRGSKKPTFNSASKQMLSRSNPQLSENGGGTFLSKQFGSTRSFNPMPNRSSSRLSLDRNKLMGGPHAAYFGSLQRLMPYNLEYDFGVMHERGLADSLDLDRMQQYWGVTTTEL